MESIVKAELRARIQLQRLLSGQEELTVDFLPSPTYELTPEEQVKVERRRRNNRISATKCRQKKRQLECRLMQEYNQLCVQNSKLVKESKILQMQVKALKHELNTHTCNLQPIANPAFRDGGHSGSVSRDVCDTGSNLHITRDLRAGSQEIELTNTSVQSTQTREHLLDNYQYLRNAEILGHPNNMMSQHPSGNSWNLPEDVEQTQRDRGNNGEELKQPRLNRRESETAKPNSVAMDHSYVNITVDDILNDITSFDLCQVFGCDLDDTALIN